MIVYLIRHTAVNNPLKLCYGQSEVELSESYKNELAVIQKKLPVQDIKKVFSSPLKRCATLADDLFNSLDIEKSPELKELNFGEWELRAWTSINRSEFDAWAEDFVHSSCPGGESYQDLYKRVLQFWQENILNSADPVAVVTHGGVIRALLAYLKNIPLKESFSVGVDYGAVIKIDTSQNTVTVL